MCECSRATPSAWRKCISKPLPCHAAVSARLAVRGLLIGGIGCAALTAPFAMAQQKDGAQVGSGAGTGQPRQVDPLTGRPVDTSGAPADIVDQRAAERDRSTNDVARERQVPAYIALPSLAPADAQPSGASRRDRALSQRVLPGTLVRQRRRQEYDAQGFRAGEMRILPYVMAGLGYDSNVYAEEKGRDDVFGSVTAGVVARSDWGRHAVAFTGDVRRREYASYDTENATTYSLDAEVRLDLAGRNNLTFHASDERAVLSRSIVDEIVTQAFPTKVRNSLGEVVAHIERGPIELDLTGSVVRQNYRNNVGQAGTVIDQSFRNYDGTGAKVAVGYDIGGLRSAYAEFSVDRRRFDSVAGGLSRDVDVFSMIGGLRGGLSQLVRGRFGLGYMKLDFKQVGIESLNAFAVDAAVDWLYSERTTFSLRATRGLRSVAQQNSLGTILTVVSLNADHEARRNLILSASLRQQWSDYIGDDRRASASGITVSATWFLDRHLQVRPELSYLKRTDRGFTIDASPENFFGGASLTYKF